MATGHSLHGIVEVTVRENAVSGGSLTFYDKHMNSSTAYMPLAAAQMMAAAWEQYRDFVEPRVDEDEPEPLDAETVAQREESYIAALRDAGRGHLVR